MRKRIGGIAFVVFVALGSGAAFWVASASIRLLGFHPAVSYAAAIVGLAAVFFVPTVAILLAVRYKKAILAALWQEPKELFRYVVRSIPGFTLRTIWAFVKFLIALTSLTAVAVGYSFVGFAALPAIWRLRGIIVGGEQSLSKIQAVAFVAAVTFAAAVTIAILRWLGRTLVAFRRRAPIAKSVPSQTASRPSAPGRPPIRIRLPAMPKLPGRGGTKRATRVIFAMALLVALFEAFVLGFRGAELAVALGFIVVLAAGGIAVYRRKEKSS